MGVIEHKTAIVLHVAKHILKIPNIIHTSDLPWESNSRAIKRLLAKFFQSDLAKSAFAKDDRDETFCLLGNFCRFGRRTDLRRKEEKSPRCPGEGCRRMGETSGRSSGALQLSDRIRRPEPLPRNVQSKTFDNLNLE